MKVFFFIIKMAYLFYSFHRSWLLIRMRETMAKSNILLKGERERQNSESIRIMELSMLQKVWTTRIPMI